MSWLSDLLAKVRRSPVLFEPETTLSEGDDMGEIEEQDADGTEDVPGRDEILERKADDPGDDVLHCLPDSDDPAST